MKRRRVTRDHYDHGLAMAARVVLGAAGVFAGVMVLRSLPEIIRYVKMDRM
jgi:hypothetical protein